MRHFLFLLMLLSASPLLALASNGIEEGAAAYYNKDYVRAFRYWALLARSGNVRAQHNIGVLYFEGQGTEQNLKNARAWFERAAHRGFARSQHNLGWMHEKGIGVTKNLQKAKRWYSKAAAQEFSSSESRLGFLLFENGDYYKAQSFLTRAARRRQPQAQFLLGEIYGKGLNGAADIELALRWYRAASNNGNSDASYALARFYLGFENRNDQQIVNLLNQAVEAGNIEATHALAFAVAKGLGVEQDEERAIELFLSALAGGYNKSAVSLAALYSQNGDYEETYMWLLIAEGLGLADAYKKQALYVKYLDKEEIAKIEQKAKVWLVKHRGNSQ